MDKIDVGAPLAGERRERFFARAKGTRFEASKTGNATQIDIYDEIGYWGVTASAFRSRLNEIDGDITLRINSPGGDVFDGIAIYNDLVAYDRGKVRVEITGIAASIASIIAMAGSEITIAENAMFMIHNAWTIGVGNRHDFGDVASTLAKIDDALARTYAANTTTGIREIKRMMDEETWLTAKEAKDAGFATAISSVNDNSTKAKFDLSVFNNAPKSMTWPDDEDDGDYVPTVRDAERALRDAGWSASKAKALVAVLKPSKHEPQRDADDVDLNVIVAALREARTAIH